MSGDRLRGTALGARLVDAFRERFDGEPSALVRAPGRVNLIGEHTDYNDGFVFPLAIDRQVAAALRPRADRRVRVRSLDFDAETGFELDALDPGRGWQEYLKGVAWALQEGGHPLVGFDAVLTGDVPRGAGLSSSAALELTAARAFATAADLAWDATAMARLCQRAENEWVGMNSGIMDQLISACGRAGHALLIDCRDLSTQAAPLPTDCRVVVLDTGTRRGLVDSAYNERRAQCEAAAAALGVTALRDATPALLEAEGGRLEPLARRRARHVVTENARTLAAAEAMRAGDAVRLGELMNASHESLRVDFEVSSPALDAIVEAARAHPACWGARMTGAGFGGCAVALVASDAVDDFNRAVLTRYRRDTGNDPEVYVCRAADGASSEPL